MHCIIFPKILFLNLQWTLTYYLFYMLLSQISFSYTLMLTNYRLILKTGTVMLTSLHWKFKFSLQIVWERCLFHSPLQRKLEQWMSTGLLLENRLVLSVCAVWMILAALWSLLLLCGSFFSKLTVSLQPPLERKQTCLLLGLLRYFLEVFFLSSVSFPVCLYLVSRAQAWSCKYLFSG